MGTPLKGILHIGMPKCMSTSIQSYLRGAESIFFAGIGPSKHVGPEMLLAFQRHIVRTPSQFYDAETVAEVFAQSVKQAEDEGAKIFALSDETIPFPLGYARADTSYLERLLRLKAVMPASTEVLMVVRRPDDYLKSTYKYRTVMNGMSCSFEDYLKRLLLLGDTNLLGTIKYYHFAEAARRIFGKVNVVAMEAIEDDEDELLRIFGAPAHAGPSRLPRENSGMPGVKFANFRELYAPFGDTLSDDDFNVVSPADRLLTQTNAAHYGGILAGALAKEQTLAALRNLAMHMPDRPAESCFETSAETRKLLMDYVSHANVMLRKHFDVATDEFDYDLF